MRIRYRDGEGVESARVIWPVMIGFVGAAWLLAAWCESRQDFRHFRIDRIAAADFSAERYAAQPAELRARWRRHLAAQKTRAEISPTAA